MNRILATLIGLGIACAAPTTAFADYGDHPQINDVTSRWTYDWSLRKWRYSVTIDITTDGFDEVDAQIIHSSTNPWSGFYISDLVIIGSGDLDREQVTDFGYYSREILNCRDTTSTAHTYDDTSTWNDEGDLSIEEFAGTIGMIRSTFGCADTQPPPLGVCDAADDASAPDVGSVIPDTVTYFDVEVELAKGQEISVGFEYDGDRWEGYVSSGSADDCGGQVDTFVDYTVEILESEDCTATSPYTSAEDTALADYIEEVEDICAANKPFECTTTGAPLIVDFDPDSSSFFYVTVELENAVEVINGFEYDGDRWEWAEVYGDPTACDEQLDVFADYTMDILTSADCTATSPYTSSEDTALATYVGDVETFCEDNK